MAKKLTDISLSDITPRNIIRDPTVQNAANSIDHQLQLTADNIGLVAIITRIDELPETVIDSLAWQWHVDFYEPGLDLKAKRNLVRESIAWHRHKGTKAAVKSGVHAVYGSGEVEEWFEYNGEPYHFRVVDIVPDTIDMDSIRLVLRLIDSCKNTRSWLDTLGVRRDLHGTIHVGGIPCVTKAYEVYPVTIHDATLNPVLYYGGALVSYQRIEIYENTVQDTESPVEVYYSSNVSAYKRVEV